MKKHVVFKAVYWIIALIMAFTVSLTACAAPSAAPAATEVKPIKAICTTAYPAGMSPELALHKMADMAKEKTKGRLIIEVHSGGELYSREDEIMALSTGAIQMMTTNTPAVASVYKGIIALGLPFFWSDYKTLRAYEATPEWQNAWKDGVEKKLGIKSLCYIPVGPSMSANKVKPINKWEDWKGLKMRAASVVDTGMYTVLGAEAVNIPVTELWTALEQGMIDGFSSTYAKFAVGPEADYGKYAVKDPAGIIEGWLFVNAAWWDSLPVDIRQIMEKDVLPEIESYATAEMETVVEKCIADTTKRGVTWSNIQNISAMKIQLKPLYEVLKSMIGNDILYDKAMEIGAPKQ